MKSKWIFGRIFINNKLILKKQNFEYKKTLKFILFNDFKKYFFLSNN